MKVWLFGATSMVGWTLLRILPPGKVVPFCNPYTRHTKGKNWRHLRLEDRHALEKLFANELPDLIIHCGGICDVDNCNQNPNWTWKINVEAVKTLLDLIPNSSRLIYSSSDHVFSGKCGPYTERVTPDPISVYGESRVAAESMIRKRKKNSLVIRSSVAIGPSIDGKRGFLDWLRYRTSRGFPLTVVEDEYRAAVWSEDLAHRVWKLACSDVTGLRHIEATRIVNRLELAEFLMKKYRIPARLKVTQRSRLSGPHLGRMDLRTIYRDKHSAALPSVLD